MREKIYSFYTVGKTQHMLIDFGTMSFRVLRWTLRVNCCCVQKTNVRRKTNALDVEVYTKAHLLYQSIFQFVVRLINLLSGVSIQWMNVVEVTCQETWPVMSVYFDPTSSKCVPNFWPKTVYYSLV